MTTESAAAAKAHPVAESELVVAVPVDVSVMFSLSHARRGIVVSHADGRRGMEISECYNVGQC